MKLIFSKHTGSKRVARLKKKVRIRRTVIGSPERPRLCIYRSAKHIYAQLIDDQLGKTVVSSSSLKVDSQDMAGKDLARHVGMDLAKKALEKNIKSAVFDRNGYLYHGRVKSLADGAREAGLSF